MGINFSEDLFFGLWEPGIDLRTPWKNFSLRPWLGLEGPNDKYYRDKTFEKNNYQEND